MTLAQARCGHPDRKVHARGRCRSCYRKDITKTRALCHPDKPHRAKGWCVDCYNSLPLTKKRNQANTRARKYGLTVPELELIISNADGRCELCLEKLEQGKTCHIDHNHRTGKVRGVLCPMCNIGLGSFRDSPTKLQRAIEYLKDRE